MSRELCNCSNLMTHPCTKARPAKLALGENPCAWWKTRALIHRETTHCPPAPQTESTTDARAGEMAKAVGTSARPGLGTTLRCPHTQLVLPEGNFQIIIIVILSQFVQEQPAVRGASKTPCKRSPAAHPDENWVDFHTPVQPNRSFNSTFSLQVVFVFQVSQFLPFTVQSLSLPWLTLIMCKNPNPHSCQSS